MLQFQILLALFLPSVVVNSGAGMKRTMIINEKTLKYTNRTKRCNFKIPLISVLPSVVAISGAGIKDKIIIN